MKTGHVAITGDLHGHHSINRLSNKRFPEGNNYTKDDYVIVCGDFGLIWEQVESENERYWLDWLTTKKKFTTLFVDGNHENFERLYTYPVVDFLGGKAGKITDSVYHLKRGEIYTIHGRTFLAFGGALSWDKAQRVLGRSLWEEEIPSYLEAQNAFDNLAKVNNQVDYIVSHTVPDELIPILGFSKGAIDPTRIYLNDLIRRAKFQRMFCGHMHEDRDIGKFSMLYNKIIEIF